jgi:catechol 2,3-dioxygenase-like lactoylglutathione lyase family enzyme
MLGFEVIWQVPATNSEEVNQAVAMTDYRVNGAIMKLRDVEPAVLIDLLEWQKPKDTSPPYANLYRPGLARLALRTSHLQQDYEFLLSQGVSVLSPPATVYASNSRGSSFFCFKDPDGIFLELVESF